MSKGIIKAIVFSIVFVAAVFIFEVVTNHTNQDLTTEMEAATLPVVNLYYDDKQINQLFGYTTEMESLYMRDSITPVDVERVLPIRIQTYGYPVDDISYEIRSMDTTRLIADSSVDEYSNQRGVLTADLEIQNILEEGSEYLMILKLEGGEKAVYYYTRIIQPADCYVKESLDFVTYFHNASMSTETSATLATYVEPNAEGDNSTLHKVNIHSTLKQISWADFAGKQFGTPNISLKEINTSYNVIELSYIMTTQGDNGQLEYYNTTESYRVRNTNERMYLLNYERTMNQIFRGENEHFYGNNLQLGIRGEDIQYMANETGKIVSFVQEGELWGYHVDEKRLTQIFSFRGYEGIDDRENNNHHDIRIIKVDESGSTDFVVYGYMNRGIHEGEVGIGVYHYDSTVNTVEEELFIPYTKSYQIMQAKLGQMMYENENNQFYIMLNKCIYEIDMNTMNYQEIITGLEGESYAVSDSHQYVAYLEGTDVNQGTVINVKDLENGKTFEIKAGQGEYVRPLGFMGNDFIYGIAKQTDVTTDVAGNTIFPMRQVRIVDTQEASHKVLKEYQKEGYYILDIEVSDFTIYLNRVQHNGVAFVNADQDTIMNREADTDETTKIGSTVTQVKQTQYQLVLKNETEMTAKKLMVPKQIVLSESKSVLLQKEEPENYYYAYAWGKVLAVTTDISEAIQVANHNMGVVIGDGQEYIWKRAKKALHSTIEVAVGESDAASSPVGKSLSALLGKENLNVGVQVLLDRGDSPRSILDDTMQEMTVLDITGCNLEEALYYVNRGTPVFAMASGTEAVLLVGYDANYVTIFDSSLGTTYKKNMEEASEMFEQAGNVFLAYLKE